MPGQAPDVYMQKQGYILYLHMLHFYKQHNIYAINPLHLVAAILGTLILIMIASAIVEYKIFVKKKKVNSEKERFTHTQRVINNIFRRRNIRA